ncbi:MDN1 [Symbiodinium microadriaticum]|nr:MDN1 [Symbiodinium microadriaticum]
MSDEDETDQVSIEETDEVEVEEEEAQEEPTEQQEEEQEPPEAQAEQEAQEAQEEEQEAQHEEQQAEQQEDQQEEEEEEEQEATEVPNDDSPIEEAEKPPPQLQPGDSVRLKGLQSDTSMNGRVGYIRGRENVEDGGRFIVELGTRGIARVREANLEKVEPTRRSERLAKAKPAAAKRSERTPKKADRVKAKAAPKGAKGPSKATQKVAVKKGSIKAARAAKEKTSGAAAQAENTTVFVVRDYRIRSDPCLEVQDSSSKWRPCHIYENYKDQHIVIWYGGNEYEGLGGKPYRLKGISPEAIFKGQPGQLLDSDGERIPTRKRPMR